AVKQTLLRDEYEGAVGGTSMPDFRFIASDVLDRPEMHGRRPGAFLRAPRNRSIQGPIDLEHTWPVSISLQPAYVRGRQFAAGDRCKLSRRYIENDRA